MEEEGEMYQGGQKINKCWGCHAQHGNIVLMLYSIFKGC